ncbi:fungal-specific transcription factor domain-containing protein [Mycena filopes]|nr:fungal-specific transcription factor domain-containing protein [Mycena filopes]
MSSADRVPKRRRLQGACDLCRKKKVRCDSLEMPGNKCTNCITFKAQCTHLYLSKDSSSSRNYKNSREHVAAILSHTTAYVPSSDPAILYSILVDVAKYARNLEELLAVSLSSSFSQSPQGSAPTEEVATPATSDSDRPEPSDDADELFVDSHILDPFRRLTLNLPISGKDENSRFFGKSSSLTFMKVALNYVDNPEGVSTFNAQRDGFWEPFLPKRISAVEPTPAAHSFPEDDLMEDLISIYFARINPVTFLLHSPSFRRSIAAGEHRKDQQFGAVVLMVCALAARVSDDPRVFTSPDSPAHTAGWKWFQQVRPPRLAVSNAPPGFRWLTQLQLICLSVLFLAGVSAAPDCWILTGMGIRIAQQMGAHRRSRYTGRSKVECELLRRAFWFLVAIDTMLASTLGRPKATTTEDYDVDMPTACDDEYWEEPYNFQQPADKPALAAYATPYLQLVEIFARVQRAIYPVKKIKECEPEVVADLDSALNKWVDSIPSHLRWDPTRRGIFLDQSTLLYTTYYYVQMLIHRPFIPAPGSAPASHSAFPALAICANSARSCGHVMEVQSRRGTGALIQSFMITVLFDSAVILLMNVWGARRAKFAPSDVARAKADVQKCVDFLHLYEKRWPLAGRKCDAITEMLNRAIGTNPQITAQPSLKRPHPPAVEDEHESQSAQLEQLERSLQETNHLFALPMSTHELGVLPVYESFDADFRYDHSEQSAEEGLFGHPGAAQDHQAIPYEWQDWSFLDYEHAGYPD